MFKKHERLSQSEFSVYFKVGKRHHFPLCTIITASSPVRKVSVVVGKKVSKLAVRRNSIRRRVYALLRKELITTPTVGVVIVVVKPTFNTLTKAVADETVIKSIAQVLKST